MSLGRKRDIEARDFGFHDLVAFVIELRLMKQGYEDLGVGLPKWLSERVVDAERELKHQRHAYKERQLVELKTRREGLLTATEKRTKLDAEIAALEAEV